MTGPETEKTHVHLKATIVRRACDAALQKIAADRDVIAQAFLKQRFPVTWRHRQVDDLQMSEDHRRILEEFQSSDMAVLRDLHALAASAAQDHHSLRVCVNIEDFRVIRSYVEELS